MPKYEIITSERNNFFINNKISVASSKPGSGSWTKGDIVYSSTPTSMCYGWMCIESGTPGNWITLNNADISPIHDTRGVNNKPKEYNVGRRTEFKSRESINNPSGGKTHTVVDTMKGWGDISGGSSIQMSYCADGNGMIPKVSVRSANNDAESWGSWYDLYHSGNKPTWNDIDGKPASFPVAAHNHDSVYLRTQMGDVTDFNLCTSTGIYYARGGTLKNIPPGGGEHGILEVVVYNGIEVMQRYQDYHGSIFTRFKSVANGGTWKSWITIYSSSKKPTWNDINGKPSSFPPASHNHDDRYYTEDEVNNRLANKSNRLVSDASGNGRIIIEPVTILSERISGYTGMIKITLPKSWSSTMLSFDLICYDYSARGRYAYHLSGYNYEVEKKWINVQVSFEGNPVTTKVRFAYDGSKCCVILGDEKTVWSYPKFAIDNVFVGHSNIAGWDSGWSISRITSENGLTSISDAYDTTAWSHYHDNRYLKINNSNVTDFNLCKTAGPYSVSSNSSVPNAPFTGAIFGSLIVAIVSPNEVTHTFTSHTGRVYTRFLNNRNGGEWTPWSQVYSQNNIPEKAGSSDLTIQPMRSNEINFGGSYKDNTFMFFGYRSIEGRPAPTIYVFGGEGGTATVQAGDFNVKGNSVYHLGNKPPASNVTLQDSSNLFTATDVEGAMKELFTNVDNGKSSIAQAIIAKGVSGASKNDTFTQLSDKIRQIKQFSLPSWVPQSGIWLSRMVDTLPEFTMFCGSVVVDNKLYAVGGQSKTDSPKNSNNNLCYDYITNKWTVKANILVPSTLGTIGYVDGKIYYISGTRKNYSDRHESIFNNQCYDIASNSWSEKANARTRRSGSCGASIDKSIYLMYGHQYNSYSPSEDIDVYNTVTNTWSSGGTIRGHSPRFEVASVTKGSQIFFMGGRDENNRRTNKFEMYDVQTKSWTTLPNIPDAINKALVAIQGDNIYLVNGTPDTNYNSTHPTYVYNITSRTWSTKPKSNLENQNGVIGFIDNKLFVVGGIKGNVVSKEGEFLIL